MVSLKVKKDERAIDVEKASYSLAYRIMAFAILIDVAYRSLKMGESPWDLMAIVIGAGLISTLYQLRQKVWTRGWVRTAIMAFALAAVAAEIIILTRVLG